jgi:hypothetical protein
MFPLPLVGLGLLAAFLLSGAEKKGVAKPPSGQTPAVPPKMPPPPTTTPGDNSAFQEVMGRLMYRPEVAVMIVNSLLYKIALPTDQPHLAMVHPGPGTPMGTDDWGAWFGLKALHEQGFDLWVPTNAHVPVALPWPVLFVKPTDPIPPEGFALLVARDEQWPPMPAV